jgi:uncharacterized surface protein with fasciclin (FAS1) repeats
MISKVMNKRFALWNGTNWNNRFLSGVDVGVTLPGMSPGELQYVTYDQWFHMLQLSYDLNVDVIRVYTLLPPQFYQAFYNFNTYMLKPRYLYLFQGVWSPLDGISNNQTDAWNSTYVNEFSQMCTEVINAVHGNITIGFRYGQAYGTYTYDVSMWLAGFILGTEWFEQIVVYTNNLYPNMTFNGTYFSALPTASAFECWLANIMEVSATEQMKYNVQTPTAFTNWITTDPLFHPLEPFVDEDLVSLDPLHIVSTNAFIAGVFASFHAYTYYPDSIRFEYTNCNNCQGNADSYAGYIRELRKYVNSMPLVISEYGLSTSRVSAHNAPQRRNQGGLTEQEQADKISDITWLLYDEGVDGGFIFALTDEFFKKCWQTQYLIIPSTKQLWKNNLAAEEFFGLISMEHGINSSYQITVDGNFNDWQFQAYTNYTNSNFNTYITSDVSGVYMMLERKNGNWSFGSDEIVIGIDVLPGGYNDNLSFYLNKLNGRYITFTNTSMGAEFILYIRNANDTKLYVNNYYDPFIYKYGYDGAWSLPSGSSRNFEDYRLPVSYSLDYRNFTYCDEPFEYIYAGQYNQTMSDYKFNGKYLEFRIVWSELGFMDPAQLKVWAYPLPSERSSNIKIVNRLFNPTQSNGINFEIQTKIGSKTYDSNILPYKWNGWTENTMTWHERKKISYNTYRDVCDQIRTLDINGQLRQCTKRLFYCKNFSKLQCVTANTYFGSPGILTPNTKTIFFPNNVPNFFTSSNSSVKSSHSLNSTFYVSILNEQNSFVTTLNGNSLRVNSYTDLRNETIITINGAVVLSPNQLFSDVVTHYIDRVLTIPTQTLYNKLAVDITLISYMLNVLGLNESNFNNVYGNLTTVFSPINNTNNYNEVVSICTNLTNCTNLLNCHIVSGIWYSAGLFDGTYLPINSNKNLYVNVQNNGSIMLFDGNENSYIITKDIPTTNGVIHYVDTVLNC